MHWNIPMTIKRRCLGKDLGRCERSAQKNRCKIDMQLHHIQINKDKKIKSIMTYSDAGVGNEINDSYSVEKTGDI
jgi:hypothetical protein